MAQETVDWIPIWAKTMQLSDNYYTTGKIPFAFEIAAVNV